MFTLNKSHETTIFLWFSYGFPMVFLGFPMVFPWFSYGFPMVIHGVTHGYHDPPRLRAAALLPGSSFGAFSLLSTQLPRRERLVNWAGVFTCDKDDEQGSLGFMYIYICISL